MRKKIIAGNWKMNMTFDEGQKLTSEIINMFKDENIQDVHIVLNPPFPHLFPVKKLIGDTPGVYLGAQNCSDKESGAFTGEVSAKILASFGAQYVIIGHSERREYFKENNELLSVKVKQALEHGLTPIFCCGESLEIREAGTHEPNVKFQLTDSLFDLSADEIKKVVIAYEPIWAIGTGKTATSDQAQEMHFALRRHLGSKYGKDVAAEISILYGGSMNAGNAADLLSKPDVDGGLIGGASLKSRDFIEIVKSY
ncbi:MAG TPA: triose-phosphate isomerase [Algoriphagus sp.]|jgi:triosephosphate isomerase|uniref:triose-phosphate isomerase n=1 Tax=Algoriphagus TaxID=246875 RepID=UPI000C634E0F|nr:MULTISPECIES: triose-phosphate isomerase [Algoriphagus]MAL15981.1 triose-phosphate isomerase [Algoriphagus sp.]MAN89044.1 triose-phosphate isomerase [Algoriphagus sp.]QYH40602.1 triose-phosphate isomerase [Algoriphagus sp. NBT04N3]HAH37746.1 triose-phosphate isomerase [Algoriphagus sp.]HAS59497.1 triose-phosphate isomerase [Algoriphagus sp.]|tara:strand:+ start:590 stop:1351 length:762 start_codon:yes stop_codon:yes gene_type:complete